MPAMRIAPLTAAMPVLSPAMPVAAAVPGDRFEATMQEVIPLTQSLVRVDSGPTNLVAGQNRVVDLMVDYARQAGLEVDRFETVNGKPMLIVTLPGKDPTLGSVGFVHHGDVVGVEGEWKLGQPFSGDLIVDERGRQVLHGRGSLDTKGPAAQILVAMKGLKESGQVLSRSMKLFVFPDEETGGKDGAHFMATNHPDKLRDVQYWLVEGSGILAPEMLNGIETKEDLPYLAMAQKYCLPMQLELKEPLPAHQAVGKTVEALRRLDEHLDAGEWTNLGDPDESDESFRRMGNAVGGFKGWMIRNFWDWKFVQRRMGPSLAAANRSDLCKTDFYLSHNPAGKTADPNVKPSSATVVLELDLSGAEREKALRKMRRAAGEDFVVEDLPTGRIELRLPQENYHGGNHGSTADREQDAVDMTCRALERVRKTLKGKPLQVADFYTSKSRNESQGAPGPVTSKVTLDLRVTVDDDRQEVLADIQEVVGPEFKLTPLYAPEENDASVRRLRSKSPLFEAAEQACREVYGPERPILFGNTTSSNDTRFLQEVNPKSETLTFVPVVFTEHGAHGPDEVVTVDSLVSGVEWTAELMQRLGEAKE